MTPIVQLDGSSLTLEEVAAVARFGAEVRLSDAARDEMQRSHAWVQLAARGDLVDEQQRPLAVYGVNTGYGSLARVRINDEQIAALSWNLVRSHAAGVGPKLPLDFVRAMMLLRANALAKGVSGVRPVLVQRLAEMLNAGVTPVVPSRGSCGSSGDLAPLAHLGLVLFRDPNGDPSGTALYEGEALPAGEAMKRAGLEQLLPGPKDGLAITNGAQLTCAITALTCFDAVQLIHQAEVAAALSWEALQGVSRALNATVQQHRPYPGAMDCASDLRRLLGGSTLVDSIEDKVQDAYSLRCTPQVLGAVRDGVRYAIDQVRVELNAVTDNPLILVDEPGDNKAFSAGMFHGEPVGFAADHLRLSLCELGSLAERRLYRLTTGVLSGNLPPLLASGLGLGFGLPQTTAAALVAENRQLAFPATVDSIPTCEDQEDHVAMSTTAARRSATVLANVRRIIAIELLAAQTALRIRKKEGYELGAGSEAAFQAMERLVGDEQHDSTASEQIYRVEAALQQGVILKGVHSAIGPLAEVARGT